MSRSTVSVVASGGPADWSPRPAARGSAVTRSTAAGRRRVLTPPPSAGRPPADGLRPHGRRGRTRLPPPPAPLPPGPSLPPSHLVQLAGKPLRPRLGRGRRCRGGGSASRATSGASASSAALGCRPSPSSVGRRASVPTRPTPASSQPSVYHRRHGSSAAPRPARRSSRGPAPPAPTALLVARRKEAINGLAPPFDCSGDGPSLAALRRPSRMAASVVVGWAATIVPHQPAEAGEPHPPAELL